MFAATLAVVLFIDCSVPLQAVRKGRAARRANDGHPIEKVITMLQGLAAKVEVEGKTEEVTYTKFEYWCTNSKKTLTSAIAESNQKIETLTESIDGKHEEEKLLAEKISALTDEIQEREVAGGKADSIRGDMASAYSKADGDYTDTIKAIDDAISFLETSQSATDAFLQSQKKVSRVISLIQGRVSADDISAMEAFVADKPRPDFKAEGDRAKHVKKYAFKSQSVIEMLKKLRLSFQDEKLDATKAETSSLNAYTLAKNARDDSIKQAKASKDAKTGLLGEAQAARGEMESSLGSAQDDLKDDSATLKQTEKACSVKKTEWNERSVTRKREIEAMKAAIDILAKAGGVRTEAPGNPVPPPSPVQAMLIETSTDPKVKAMQLIRASASATHSRSLERLAQEISVARAGHFDQVINMIQKMIFRLMDEQKDEDSHKHWCDLELNKTDVSITDKANKMLELDTKFNKAEARISELAGEIEEADKMVATITDHMAEATEIRKIGKKENAVAVKDAKDAQEAISNAISVLEAFYKDSGMVKKEAWELLQKAPVTLPNTPSTWAAGYAGVADPKEQPAGIIAVLKTVSADFAKMESDTIAQEETDDQLYDEDMKNCEIDKARRATESQEKTSEKKRQVEKAASLKASHKNVAGQKEAVEQYLKDLQHGCVDGDSTYEDRKADRQKEIDALKEAQATLTDAFKAKNSTDSGSPAFIGLRGGMRSA